MKDVQTIQGIKQSKI